MDKVLLDLSIDVQNDDRTSLDARAVIKKLRDHIEKLEDDREERINEWMRLLSESQARSEELEEQIEREQAYQKEWANQSRELQTRIYELTEAITRCRQAVLPDPHDEREISADWLQIVILSETDILLKQGGE